MERTIRGFKLIEPIARGGMAVVYKAIQTSVNRVVAVKELHQHLVADSEFIDRFKREATAAANLHHENIIIIHDYGEEVQPDGQISSYIIAMEYVEGKSLKDLLEGGKRLPLAVVLNIAVQICRGLEHAHSKGVIHRDIKPANIIIGNDGYVKIADFGLAHSSHLPSMTVTGATLGTPAYMSPEQAAGNRKIDARADIFSMGVVLYEMVTGVKPFLGETYPATITRILTYNPEPVHKIAPSVPLEFSQVIEKCIYKDVDKRYPSVSELLKELQFCAEKNGIAIEHHLLREFVKAPEEFEKKYYTMLVKQLMDKGLYYMNLGLEKIDDAIQMFTHILQIQPDNALAREYLEKLNNEKKKLQKAHGEGKATAPVIEEKKVVIKKPAEAKQEEKRRGMGIYLIGGLIGLGILAGAIGLFIFEKKETPQNTPVALEEQKGAPVAPPTVVSPPVTPPPAPVEEPKQEEQKLSKPEPSPVKEVKPPEPVPVKKKELPREVVKKPPPKIEKREEPERAKPTEVVAVDMTHPRAGEQEPPKAPIEYSYLMVRVNPWADVYIDNKLIARTPLKEPIPVPVGEHVVKLVNPDFSVFEKKINFKAKTPDKPLVINISLEPIGGR